MELLSKKIKVGGGIVVWLEDFKTNHLSGEQKTSEPQLLTLILTLTLTLILILTLTLSLLLILSLLLP